MLLRHSEQPEMVSARDKDVHVQPIALQCRKGLTTSPMMVPVSSVTAFPADLPTLLLFSSLCLKQLFFSPSPACEMATQL